MQKLAFVLAISLLSVGGIAIRPGLAQPTPVAQDQSVTTVVSIPHTIKLYATDVDSRSLTFSIGTLPSHGALNVAAMQTLCTPSGAGAGCVATVPYTPAPGFTGRDSFTFTVSDGTHVSNPPASVAIAVIPIQVTLTLDKTTYLSHDDPIMFAITFDNKIGQEVITSEGFRASPFERLLTFTTPNNQSITANDPANAGQPEELAPPIRLISDGGVLKPVQVAPVEILPATNADGGSIIWSVTGKAQDYYTFSADDVGTYTARAIIPMRFYPALQSSGGDNYAEYDTGFGGVIESNVVRFTVNGGVQCPGPPGTGAAGTGCAFAIRQPVTLHTINLGSIKGVKTGKSPLANVKVRVFDTNNPDFQQVVSSLGGTNPKNPKGELYGMIFEANTGRVGECVTGSDGVCTAGEVQQGDYLIIARHVDTERCSGVTGTCKTVYVGRKQSNNFTLGVATQEAFQIIKTFRNNVFESYKGGDKIVVTGSFLEMIVPTSDLWEGTETIYPYIFSSDSTWTVDICAQVPSGYTIVGVFDEDGNLLTSSADCVQTLVAGTQKIMAFKVVETGSPEPSIDTTLTVRGPRGKKEVHRVRTEDIRRKSFDEKVREAKKVKDEKVREAKKAIGKKP